MTSDPASLESVMTESTRWVRDVEVDDEEFKDVLGAMEERVISRCSERTVDLGSGRTGRGGGSVEVSTSPNYTPYLKRQRSDIGLTDGYIPYRFPTN